MPLRIPHRTPSRTDGLRVSTPLMSFQDKVVNDLESLKVTVEQHSVMLQEILTAVRTKNCLSLNRPTNTPDLPIDHKADFAAFESWLETNSNFTYMVQFNLHKSIV